VEDDVDSLERTPLGRFVKHGYCELPAKEAEVIARAEMDERQFQVASHRFMEVTTSQDGQGMFYDAEEGIICHQVFAAALNFAGSVTRTPATEKVAQMLLNAEYKLAVLCAWENRQEMVRRKMHIKDYPGMNKLFLALLGDGVFANSVDSICHAICGAKDLIIASGLQVFVGTERGGLTPEIDALVRETRGQTIEL
jgi:hypothetical protein